MKIRNNKTKLRRLLQMLCGVGCVTILLALPDRTSRTDEIIVVQDSDAVAQATASESLYFETKAMRLKSDPKAVLEMYEGKEALYVAAGETVCLDVELEQAASYYIELDYYVPGSMLMTTKAAVSVNGQLVQSDIPLPAQWINDTEYAVDEFENELCRMPQRLYEWESVRLNSSLYQYRQGIAFALNAGSNCIEIEVSETDIYISQIKLVGQTATVSYRQWYSEQTEMTDGAVYELVQLEAEHFSFQSNAQIHAAKSRDTNLSPFTAEHNSVNCLDGTSWDDASDAVTWTLTAPVDGYYAIALCYRQSDKTDLPSWRQIYIDGEVPFVEFYNYPFAYTGNQNKNELLSADGETVYFYMTAGEHTVTLCATAEQSATANEAVQRLVADMNQIALNIRSVTGGKSDENREWNIEKNIPTLRTELEDIVSQMEALEALLAGQNGADSAISDLKDSRNTILQYLYKKKGLDRLVNNIGVFAQASGSMAESISQISETLLAQPLTVDRIYLVGRRAQLPPANVTVFTSVWRELRKLMCSYHSDGDDGQRLDKDALNIWVLGSAPQVETLKQLVSERFGTGNVNVSILQDESKLLLAVASGETPDVVLGGSRTKPYDLGLRGAVYDLTQFEDFKDYSSQFQAAYFVPFIEGNAVYALPQTLNFYATFYRKDILESLELEVPESWDELIEILPVLYRNGLSVNTTIANAGSVKPLVFTQPLIRQYGGTLYAEDGLSVSFGEAETMQAFTLMTEMYTKYSMPTTVSNFYLSFRNGTVPLGVSDIGTYLLLRTASTEINGAWGISPAIGVRQEDGSINNDYPAVASPCYILSNTDDPDGAWAFLKWWMSKDTQLSFSEMLCATYGEEYLWISANLDALEQCSSIPAADKQVILTQLRNCEEVPCHPAWMLVERSLSNAWNSVVFSGVDTRTALDRAITDENRDVKRKVQEFGFIDDQGNLICEVELASTEKAVLLTGGEWNEE